MKSFRQFFTEATVRGEQGHQALDDYRMSKRTDTPLEVGRVGAKPVSYTHLTLPTIYSV